MKKNPFVSITKLLLYIFLIILLSACGQQDAAVTNTQVTATFTASPPIATHPTYTKAPILRELFHQIISPGDSFQPLVLEDFLLLSEAPFEELTWTVSGLENLQADIIDGKLEIAPIDTTWVGCETLTLEVCNPSELCASKELGISILDSSISWMVHTDISGYIIMVGGKKVAIDVMINRIRLHVPERIQYAIDNSLTPFDDIDLLLITHEHHDHFSADVINNYLADNPETSVIGTKNTIDKLLRAAPNREEIQDRVYIINPQEGETEVVTVAGIEVEAFFLSHGIPSIQNYGYLFTLEGITFFHTGDIDIESNPLSYLIDLDLPERGIDIGFIPNYLVLNDFQTEYIQEGFKPRYIVPAHTTHSAGDSDTYGENAILILGPMTCQILTPEMFEE